MSTPRLMAASKKTSTRSRLSLQLTLGRSREYTPSSTCRGRRWVPRRFRTCCRGAQQSREARSQTDRRRPDLAPRKRRRPRPASDGLGPTLDGSLEEVATNEKPIVGSWLNGRALGVRHLVERGLRSTKVSGAGLSRSNGPKSRQVPSSSWFPSTQGRPSPSMNGPTMATPSGFENWYCESMV